MTQADLSRLGRNYLETGVYLEMYFPEHNVRYIAINDSVDTVNSETVDYTPFRNIANEFYARDTSKKVKSAKRARVLSGMYVAGSAPYGYMKAPEDNHRLIVDERYAPNVRKIFELALDGNGISKIRNYINSQHILRPSAVNTVGGYERLFDGEDDPKRYEWSNNSVRGILRNPVYAGHLVTNKRISPSFKSKKRFSVLPEDYIIVRNIHEPIISPDKFDTVQRLITSRRSNQKEPRGFDNIFTGLVKCEDCGKAMVLMKARRTKRENPIDNYGYCCNGYRSDGKKACTVHWIEARDLYEGVLEDIRKHADKALKDNDRMVENLLREIGSGKRKQSKIIARELKEKKIRLSEVDRLFQKLYEDKVYGKLSERNFNMMSKKYEEEQTELQSRIDEITDEMSEDDCKAENAGQFARLIRDYAGIKELDAALLNTLIEKITVGERKKSRDGITQEIKIYYKFIGNIS